MEKPEAKGGSAINRIKTGIAGLDQMLYGGLPEGTQNLIMGSVGTGKSLLAFNILYNNAKLGAPCTFITVDQARDDLIRNAKSAFPELADIDELLESKKLNVVQNTADDKFYSRENAMLFIARMIKAVHENSSRMVVIDSISLIRSLLDDDRGFTRMVNSITENMRIIGVTSIITIEIPEETGDKVPGLYEESMFDGIIKLTNSVDKDTTRHLGKIVKLRYSDYKSAPNLIQITAKGIVVQPA